MFLQLSLPVGAWRHRNPCGPCQMMMRPVPPPSSSWVQRRERGAIRFGLKRWRESTPNYASTLSHKSLTPFILTILPQFPSHTPSIFVWGQTFFARDLSWKKNFWHSYVCDGEHDLRAKISLSYTHTRKLDLQCMRRKRRGWSHIHRGHVTSLSLSPLCQPQREFWHASLSFAEKRESRLPCMGPTCAGVCVACGGSCGRRDFPLHPSRVSPSQLKGLTSRANCRLGAFFSSLQRPSFFCRQKLAERDSLWLSKK